MSGDELWKREQEEAQQLARLADPLRKTRERIDPMRHAMGESRHKAEEMADPMKLAREQLGATHLESMVRASAGDYSRFWPLCGRNLDLWAITPGSS